MEKRARTDEAKLDRFIVAVTELENRRGLRDRTVLSKLTLGVSGAPQFDRGDIEDLRSLLLGFRGFVAASEDISVKNAARQPKRWPPTSRPAMPYARSRTPGTSSWRRGSG